MAVIAELADWEFHTKLLKNGNFIHTCSAQLDGNTLQGTNEWYIRTSEEETGYPLLVGYHTYIINASFKTDDIAAYPNYAELHWYLFHPELTTENISLPMYYINNKTEMQSSYNEFQNPIYCGRAYSQGSVQARIRAIFTPSTDDKYYLFRCKILQSKLPTLGLL